MTRFYTSKAIWHAMSQMEEFDSSLRKTVEEGGDQAVQFIRQAQDGSIVPCNPSKILISKTQTLGPHKRILPIGFQTGYRTGAKGIGAAIEALDSDIERLCGFANENEASDPAVITLAQAADILQKVAATLEFPEDDAPPFDWGAAVAALTYLSQQAKNITERGKILVWAAKGRNIARLAGIGTHAKYAESPDSDKTEGRIARLHATDKPILFLLRQNGSKEKGWRDTPFYWPVIRAQGQTPKAIYTSETTS